MSQVPVAEGPVCAWLAVTLQRVVMQSAFVTQGPPASNWQPLLPPEEVPVVPLPVRHVLSL
jgi:hypothetical protein